MQKQLIIKGIPKMFALVKIIKQRVEKGIAFQVAIVG
jgi:hypothetical protein